VETVNPLASPERELTYVDIGSIDNSTQVIANPRALLGSTAPSRARQLLRSGDTVFSTVRPYLRNIGFVGATLDGAVGSTGFAVLRPISGIHSRYLYYHSLTNEFVDGLSAVMRGTSYPAVVDRQVREMPIAVAPTCEQERIVAVIEEQFSRLDVGVAALGRARQNLKRMKASILLALLKGGMVDSDTAQWEQRSLADVVTIASGQTPKGLETATVGRIPYFKVGDMNFTDGVFMAKSRAYVDSSAAARFGLHIRPAGTVIFPKRGGAIATNKKRILSVPSAYDLNTVGLVPGPDISSRFLHIWISALDLSTLADGSNVPQINHGDLSNLQIYVPSKDEQVRIVEAASKYLDHVRVLEAAVERGLQRSEHLRASILSTAFTGRLVPQCPDDEPVSMLFERIRTGSTFSKRKGSRHTQGSGKGESSHE
jgi:type I restriction enzyme, S subunit